MTLDANTHHTHDDSDTTPTTPSSAAYRGLLDVFLAGAGHLPGDWTEDLVVRNWVEATQMQRALYVYLADHAGRAVPTTEIIDTVLGIVTDTSLSGVVGSSSRRWWRYGLRTPLFECITVRGPRASNADYARYRMSAAVARRIHLLALFHC